jgi:hypothetical protein
VRANRISIIEAGAIASAIALFAGCAAGKEVVAAPSAGRTQVSIFTPEIPNAPVREGYCWTESIAVNRPGAWRCMIGNSIEDPCFSVATVSDAVVCGASPIGPMAGFLMKLTRPLPASQGAGSQPPAPWIVELTIGQGQIPEPYTMPPPKTYCVASTGTVPVIQDQPVRYSCWQHGVESRPNLGDTQIGLLDDFKPGSVWTVSEVFFKVEQIPLPNQPPFKLVEKKTIALERVWE